MFKPGIVSVTFRELSIDGIIDLCRENCLSAIEIGGDVHLRPGDLREAERISVLCREAEVFPVSYGSYYRCEENSGAEDVIDTAAALGASNIRIWAGNVGSAALSGDMNLRNRANVAAAARNFCRAADKRNLSVSFEWHQNTLTDTLDSALRLIEDINEPNLSLYWQPNQFREFETNIYELKAALPHVSNIHVFAWRDNDKFPLCEQAAEWESYLSVLSSDGRERALLLEFMPNGKPEELVREAAALKSLIEGTNCKY